MHNDPWITSHSFLSPEKTHALGFLSLVWAACEARTHEMFHHVSGLPTQVARIVIHDLGQVSIWVKIVQIAIERQLSNNFVEHLKHLKNFNQRCRENRNQFVHFGLGMSHDSENTFGLIRTKGFAREIDYLNDSLDEIRRVCEDCQIFVRYFWEVHHCSVVEAMPQLPARPWPAKPKLPEPVWQPQSPVSTKQP